jgi:stage III sporulation protein AA
MALRSMSPQVIVTDELVTPQDVDAIEQAMYNGVSVVASAHGRSMEEMAIKPVFRKLFDAKVFEILFFLDKSRGTGTLREIVRFGGKENA